MKAEGRKEYSRHLSLLLRGLAMSQAGLAKATGLSQSDISYYLAGKKEPGKLACLLFAGLSTPAEERAYWVSLARLTGGQRQLLAASLEVETAAGPQEELVSTFLEFWERPQTGAQKALRDLLLATVFADRRKGPGSR